MAFGDALVDALEQQKMSRAEFADRGGFSSAYVSMLIGGSIQDPKFSRVKEICDALGMSLGDFSAIYDKHEH